MHYVNNTELSSHEEIRRQFNGGYSGHGERFAGHIGIQCADRRAPMIEKYPLSRVAEAYEQMHSGKVRFRVVLTMGA